ncbi:hypothetical protein ACWGDE_07705 [Streptomyces sp. NPDC054956]
MNDHQRLTDAIRLTVIRRRIQQLRQHHQIHGRLRLGGPSTTERKVR